MKTYQFKVEMQDLKPKGGFLDSINDEINDEKRQLDLTHKIHKEVTKMHYKMLLEIVKEVNKEIAPLDMRFVVRQYDTSDNEYFAAWAEIEDRPNGMPFLVISLRQYFPSDFHDSMYSTYLGDDYTIKAGSLSSYIGGSRTGHWDELRAINKNEDVIDGILDRFRESFKKYINLKKKNGSI